MVSALLNDALSDPVALITTLYHDHSSENFEKRVTSHFHEIFKADDAFKQIPALDVLHPPASFSRRTLPLVRFRAMVQDTSASSEIYPALLRNGTPGGWGLAESAAVATSSLYNDSFSDIQHLKERDVLWAVSIPGESPFVAEYLDDADQPPADVGFTPTKLLHKDPLARENHISAQVKIYDSSLGNFKPTELYTFVGFLALEQPSTSEDDDASEDSAVPTIHTLFTVKHTLALVAFDYPSRLDAASGPVLSLREEIIRWIANQALGGDRDAALWVLLASISRVQSRQPPLFPLSLTLSKFPKPDAPEVNVPALSHVLRCLLPIFVDLPLSLQLINSRPFSPESREDSLHAGLLQLPGGATVLLWDIAMEEGKITEAGITNIQALRNAMTMQIVDYRFPYTTPYQFPTDLSFICLTEGKASPFVETQVTVPLQPGIPGACFRSGRSIQHPPAAQLEAFRQVIGGAKVGDIKVTAEISEHIQTEFVRERKAGGSNGEELMVRMSIARLLALTRNEKELTIEVWEEAKGLDERRKGRC